ncbi:MAG TPA: hypothetical protein VNZ52_07150, partial [Candidatus Thermoplasmatota archaeon]|nr:hypothetical protein [Candidatus Thermoplasmatota archaeon]
MLTRRLPSTRSALAAVAILSVGIALLLGAPPAAADHATVDLALSGHPNVPPGASTTLTAQVTNPGAEAVTVSLQATLRNGDTTGWNVAPSGSATNLTVPPGGTTTVSFTVTTPSQVDAVIDVEVVAISRNAANALEPLRAQTFNYRVRNLVGGIFPHDRFFSAGESTSLQLWIWNPYGHAVSTPLSLAVTQGQGWQLQHSIPGTLNLAPDERRSFPLTLAAPAAIHTEKVGALTVTTAANGAAPSVIFESEIRQEPHFGGTRGTDSLVRVDTLNFWATATTAGTTSTDVILWNDHDTELQVTLRPTLTTTQVNGATAEAWTLHDPSTRSVTVPPKSVMEVYFYVQSPAKNGNVGHLTVEVEGSAAGTGTGTLFLGRQNYTFFSRGLEVEVTGLPSVFVEGETHTATITMRNRNPHPYVGEATSWSHGSPQWTITGVPSGPLTVAPGETRTFPVTISAHEYSWLGGTTLGLGLSPDFPGSQISILLRAVTWRDAPVPAHPTASGGSGLPLSTWLRPEARSLGRTLTIDGGTGQAEFPIESRGAGTLPVAYQLHVPADAPLRLNLTPPTATLTLNTTAQAPLIVARTSAGAVAGATYTVTLVIVSPDVGGTVEIPFTVHVQQPTAVAVTVTPPPVTPRFVPGERRDVTFTVRNDGPGGHAFNLVPTFTAGTGSWTASHDLASPIAEGETRTITLQVTAPSEGAAPTWLTVSLDLPAAGSIPARTVATGYAYLQMNTVDVLTYPVTGVTLQGGATQTVSLVVRNPNPDTLRVLFEIPQDNLGEWSFTRTTPATRDIAPGATVEFGFRVAAPSTQFVDQVRVLRLLAVPQGTALATFPFTMDVTGPPSSAPSASKTLPQLVALDLDEATQDAKAGSSLEVLFNVQYVGEFTGDTNVPLIATLRLPEEYANEPWEARPGTLSVSTALPRNTIAITLPYDRTQALRGTARLTLVVESPTFGSILEEAFEVRFLTDETAFKPPARISLEDNLEVTRQWTGLLRANAGADTPVGFRLGTTSGFPERVLMSLSVDGPSSITLSPNIVFLDLPTLGTVPLDATFTVPRDALNGDGYVLRLLATRDGGGDSVTYEFPFRVEGGVTPSSAPSRLPPTLAPPTLP